MAKKITTFKQFAKFMENQKDNADLLKFLIRTVNEYDDRLSDYKVYENDEEFFEMMFSNTMDAVRAVSFGEYDYMAELVRVNVYGNLVTLSECEYSQEVKEAFDDIMTEVESLWDNKYVGPEIISEIQQYL